MMRRPLCLLALGLMLALVCADALGWSDRWKSPAGSEPFAWADGGQGVWAEGILYTKEEKESCTCLYIRQTSLKEELSSSVEYPIRNLKCYVCEEAEALPDEGAAVLLCGTLARPAGPTSPGGFDETRYMAAEKIDFYLRDARVVRAEAGADAAASMVRAVREKLCQNLEAVFDGRQAGVLEAMLLGARENLDEEIRANYQAAGISHVLAISGLHISLLGMGLWTAFLWLGLPAWCGGAAASLLLGFYGVLVQNPASAMRAVLMCVTLMGARLAGRSYDRLSALSLAAILVLLDNPDLLFYCGFQLSFLAVLALETFARVWKDGILGALENRKGKWARWIKKRSWAGTLSASAGIWFMTLPVTLVNFYQVSLLGFLLNLLVLPVFSVLVASGLAAMLLAFVHVPLAAAAGLLAGGILSAYDALTEWAAQVPFGVWTPGEPGIFAVCLYYLALAAWYLNDYLAWRRREERRLSGAAGSGEEPGKRRRDPGARTLRLWRGAHRLGIPLACAAFCLFLMSDRDCPAVRLTMLDVGQGESIVLQASRTQILLDGGSTSRSLPGKYVILPYLKQQGIASLEAVFVTHPDEDHVNGIREVLAEAARGWLTVGCLCMPEWMEQDTVGLELAALAGDAGIPCVYLRAGDEIALGGHRLTVLAPEAIEAPEDANSGSLVLVWEAGGLTALFTGDLPIEAEGQIEAFPVCDILKAAHHGSRYATSAEMIAAVSPRLALISCGANNRYGHPAEELLERFAAAGVPVRRTDVEGAVILDGPL